MNGMTTAIWPLFDLVVSTPRLTLRYIDDDLGEQLAELAAEGIHDPAVMPFSQPWTDVPPPEMQRNTVRYFRRNRAETTSERWHLNLAASDRGGELLGMCSLETEHFLTTRTAETGSWLGQRYQRQGFGKEMRQAVLHLAFAGLDAERATTSAWHDNAASLGVTRSLPYTEDGSTQETRRGRPGALLAFSMSRERWQSIRRDDIAVDGLEPVREFLGVLNGRNEETA